MKIIVGLLFALTLVSCGARKKVVTEKVNPYDNSANDARLDVLEQRVFILEAQVVTNISAMDAVQLQLDSLAAEIAQEGAINTSQQASINNLTALLNSLQIDVTNNITDIAELKENETIVEYLDPCGNSSGYDEILMKTSSGNVIAYFESGNKRFLSILEPNTLYQTTDNSSCQFKITDDGELVY